MYKYKETENGIEVIDSYKVFWDKETINHIYYFYAFERSKFSLYLEWFIHTLCYKLGIQKERAKNVYFEYDNTWFKKLF